MRVKLGCLCHWSNWQKRYMMKRILLFCGLLASLIPATVFANPARAEDSSALKNAVILIIRHAEPDHGHGLSSAGKARARAYANYFKNFTIDGQPLRLDYLFAARDSSISHRPLLTIEPTAKELGLTVNNHFYDKQFLELAHEIQSRPLGTNYLICWHHGNIPRLLRALGADTKKLLPHGKWPGKVFSWLIQLRYDETGHLFESKRINANLLPGDSS